MVLDPELVAAGIDPHVGVARVAVHVAVGLGDTAVAHQPRHLVGGLGRQRPEVPLHVVVTQSVVGAALLAADEVLELHRVADEEDRRVVADHVVVALGRIELQREAARVAPGVGAAALAGDGGEAGEHLGLDARLEQGGPGVGAHVLGRLEHAERARALGVRLALGNPLAVEVGHLLDQVLVLKQDRAVRTDGQREFVAGDRDCRRRLWCEGAYRSSSGLLLSGLDVCLAGGAQAPESDLGLVDDEAAGVRRRHARRLTDDTIDVGDRAARAAHRVDVAASGKVEKRRRRQHR